MINHDGTVEMINHLKEIWGSKNTTIYFPSDMKFKKEWSTLNRDDIRVIKYKPHPDAIKPIAEEWEVIVHDVFKLGVVKNKYGFYVEQLKYK